ncbi:hypothetical protein ACFV9W_12610 [Streptomyces sp. NPDC059897]|uniref:hypothetical protein n=1 Tax=Streptomyces sp. NPDC059897 TaxID=3346994 RepID=UPI0036682D83
MKHTITTHQLRGRRDLERDAKYLAPEAIRQVSRAVNGRMPAVEITLTTPKGLAELGTQAEVELSGCTDRRTIDRARRTYMREARDHAGRALPRSDGSVVVLVNADQHRTTEDLALTLVHELTHAMQFSRRGVLDALVQDLRAAYRVERQSRRDARAFARVVEEHEREAYDTERLAKNLH